MTPLTPLPISYNGQAMQRGEFGLRTHQGGAGFVPEGISAIVFYCPNGTNRICQIPLTLGPPVDADARGERLWHWDGNMRAPTITPSIGCNTRCGWHGHITAGHTHP